MQNAQKTGSGNLYSRTCKFLHFTAKTVTRLVCKTHYLEVAGIISLSVVLHQTFSGHQYTVAPIQTTSDERDNLFLDISVYACDNILPKGDVKVGFLKCQAIVI
jgi:hypothetical protein